MSVLQKDPRQLKQAIRSKLNIMYATLFSDRSTFIPHWRDLSDFICPRRPRYFISDVNRGDRRDQHILDSTATQAWLTCAAGMMSSITSPTRPWFKLGVADPILMKKKNIQVYFEDCEDRMRTAFYESNLYNVLPEVYQDLAAFGTPCAWMEEDFEKIFHFRSLPIGSFMLANDEKDRVRVMYREFEMTVRQLLEKFGERDGNDKITNWDHFSSLVKSHYEKNQLDVWIQVVHVVFPNQDFDENMIEAKYKKFRSIYYERGTAPQHSTDTDDADYFLSDGGYDFFPPMAPRWGKTGEDVYATICPGMVSLGDIRQLQILERRIMMAAEKMVNPPMKADPSLRNSKLSLLPGDISWVSSREKSDSFAPVFEVKFDIKAAQEKQIETRNRINKNFYADLFRMMTDSDRREITAYEVAEKKGEKLLMLGPMVENFNQDLLNPLIQNSYFIMDRRGLLPKKPDELKGTKLSPQYISIMAQAQKFVGLAGMEQFKNTYVGLSQVDPTIMDKVDMHQYIDIYADELGISPKIIRDEQATQVITKAKADAAQKQQQAEMLAKGAQTAKTLGETPTDGNNMLNNLTGNQ